MKAAGRLLASCSAAALVVALLALAGCKSTLEGEPRDSMRHKNWWNFYARGTERLGREDFEAAARDLERALGIRSGARFGYERDSWRVRTYGMHILDGYFPNREYGICLFHQGRIDTAIEYLERSLEQEPSGRARYFMNKARAAKLQGRAMPAPVIELAPTPGLTAQRSLTLKSRATADAFVRALRVNDLPEFIELAEKELDLKRDIHLREGANTFTVAATDLLGQTSEEEVSITADWTPPMMSISGFKNIGNQVEVSVAFYDIHGLASVELTGLENRQLAGRERQRFATEVRISERVPTRVRATDRAGNTLDALLDTRSLVARHGERPEVLLAQAGDTDMTVLTDPEMPKDRLPPALRLRGAVSGSVVEDEEFFVDGTASDGGGLKYVGINGENLLTDEDRGAVKSYFARRLPLALGTNNFELVAMDVTGNKTRRELSVVRVKPEHLSAQHRMRVGVPPLLPEKSGFLRARVKHTIESGLLHDPVRFRLLERDEGWDYVLREQGLSLSDLADPRAALQIGRIMPAEMLLMGRLMSEAKGVTIYVKVVETSNGEVLCASDVYCADPDMDVEEQVAGLVMKIKHRFPLLHGEVLKKRGKKAILNVGANQGALIGSHFLILRKDEKTGKNDVWRHDGKVVEIALNSIERNSGTGRIIPPAAADALQEGDHVYAR